MRVTFSPKPLVFLFAICLASTSLLAQLGVGTQQIDPSAMLEVYSDTSGVLFPRMTAAQRDAIKNPAEGLMLMCTDCNDSALYVFFQGSWSPLNYVNINSALEGIIILDSNNNMYTYHDSIDPGNPGLSGNGNHRNLTLGTNVFDLLAGGEDNIGIGHNVMSTPTTSAKNNLIIGNKAGPQDTSVNSHVRDFRENTAVGNRSMSSQHEWSGNVAIGFRALEAEYTSSTHRIIGNVAVGAYAGGKIGSGSDFLVSGNTFIGSLAGNTTTTEKNVHLGYAAGENENTYGNTLYIANSNATTPLIGGAFDQGNVGIGKSIAELQDGANFQVAGDISVAQGADINEFSTDVHLSDGSFTALPTEGAVKAYVDSTTGLITAANNNIYLSSSPLTQITTGARNLAIGNQALKSISTSSDVIAIGTNVLDSVGTSTLETVIIGNEAAKNGDFYDGCVGLGHGALKNVRYSESSTAIGFEALALDNTQNLSNLGGENTALGYRAGSGYLGHGSVFIGANSGSTLQNKYQDYILYIGSTTIYNPLIGGSFANKNVGINRSITDIIDGATLQVGGDFSVEKGAEINEFSTDVSLSDSSFIAVPTEGAVKGYVDNLSDNLTTNLIDTLTNDLPRLSVHANGSNNYHTNLDNFGALLATSTRNNAIGQNALKSFQDGDNNLGVGHASLNKLSDGDDNVSLGNWSLNKLSSGDRNLSVGTSALRNLSAGSENVALGYHAGKSSNGSNNVFLGSYAGSVSYGSNLLYVENSNTNTPLIGGNFSKNTVGINRDITDLNAGHTLQVNGTISSNTGVIYGHSDKRLKKNVERLQSEEMLNKVLQMQGVTYEWNDTVTGYDRVSGTQHGFIAQSLQEVWPTKVEEDALGYLNTSYGTYDPMFVESIKALYAKIENLESDNGQLKTQNQALKEKAEAQSLEQNKKMQALLERVEELEKKSEKSSSSTLTAGAK